MLTVFIARSLNPLVWRFPGHAARKLHAFALAELGSMIDMRLAAALTPSPERAAAYLRHADDEARHARMFERRAEQLVEQAGRKPRLGPLRVDTERLFARLGEAGFLAFVHLGEARARGQFEAYAAWFRRVGRERDHALFERVLVDERRHVAYTWDSLVAVAGSEAEARRALRRAARWELGRRWLRAGRFVAERVYGLAMLVLYVLAAPLGLLVRWARPVRAGWAVARPSSLPGEAPLQLATGDERRG